MKFLLVHRGWQGGWCGGSAPPSLPGVWDGKPIVRGEREMWDLFRVGPPDSYPTRTPFPHSRFPVHAFENMARQSVPRWPGNGELAYQGLVDTPDELGPYVLIAHSQGGGLSARAAAARPDLVRAAVLIEPHGLPDAAPPTRPSARPGRARRQRRRLGFLARSR
jgi:pimeloyl-ACP methyl ester carboxylesterase